MDQKGFTIIEVLVAIAIFAIGMLAIGAMQIGATNANTTARISTELTAFAEDKMEKLTRVSFDDFPDGDVNLTVGQIQDLIDLPLNLSDDGRMITENGRFAINCTVEEDAIIESTKTVTLEVTEIMRTNQLTVTLQQIIPRM